MKLLQKQKAKYNLIPHQRVMAVVVLLAITISGCGGSALDGGVLLQAANESGVFGNAGDGRSTATLDTDRDGIPDEIEMEIGTSPEMLDTDMDGLSDHYELWGYQGLAVGLIGSLENLNDANGNGINAALDPADMADQVLKNASAVLGQERVPAAPSEDGAFLPNDMDGDGIPNNYELHGFYFAFDENNEPWFYKWTEGDYSKKYFKTDPTKWSTDGDPFSDWEESTKINLDQRVKIPGDHPCIPAYPDVHFVLERYEIIMNNSVEIESSNGVATERAWANSVSSAWNKEVINDSEMGFGGYADANIGVGPSWGEFEISAGFQMRWAMMKTTNIETATTITEDTSGLTTEEWATARTTTGNSLEAAFLNLNLLMVNTGTMAADNVNAVCNLRIGNFIIESFLAGNGENGPLDGRSGTIIPLQVSTTGRATPELPTGAPLMLTENQLRSLMMGAPLSIEVVSFEADTLVWETDPDTGRRSFLHMGDWSPYKNAIQNVSAILSLDFGDDPTYNPQVFNGLPIKRIDDVRVACFPLDGTYEGSPPRIDLLDAFIWAFEMEPSDFGPVITIRDSVSNWKHKSLIVNWEFGFDRETVDQILSDPQKYENLFILPLEPGNPVDRVYNCKAPPQGDLVAPKIYWSLCDPATRKIRAFSRDVRGIKEMRFKPDPAADYDGEIMSIGYDPQDPDMQFFYTYTVPTQYHWTGFERVVAINGDDKKTELEVKIVGDQLGFLVDSGNYGVIWDDLAGDFQRGFNFEGGVITNPDYDFIFTQSRGALNELVISLAPQNNGSVHDALYVLDPFDTSGNPLLDETGNVIYTLDYNYLRKQSYGLTTIGETIAKGINPTPPLSKTYAVRSKNGKFAVFKPVLEAVSIGGGEYKYTVSAITWRVYEGI